MEKYNYTEIYYPAKPRSKRVQESASSGVSSSVSFVGGATTIDTDFDIFQGKGISIDRQTDGRVSYTISHGYTSDIDNTENDDTTFVNHIEFDEFGHAQTIQTIRATDLFDDRYLRKDVDDTAQGNILFEKKAGSSVFLDGYDGKGWEITNNGAALLDAARVRSDIFIGGKFGSPSFASGFTGHGVEIDIPTASGTVDHWNVRKSMKVYELVYSQIYGLGGSVIISDQNKIKQVEVRTGVYRCYLDTMDNQMRMNLRKYDIVRMQRSSGISIRYFYAEVIEVTSDYFDLRIIDGIDIPEAGDVVFRFGNKYDTNRQGLIYLTSSDDRAPYIDVLDGMTDQSMSNKVKVRMGNLSGIRTKQGVQLDKYGIYANGAVFEDTDIYLSDGTTVAQQFSIMNGKLESTIEGVRNDMSLEPGNILRNSSFGQDTNYWNTTNDISLMKANNAFLWMVDAFYSEKRKVADIYRDGNKNVLRIRNTVITQKNEILSGSKSEGTYSFSFHYKVLRPGTITIGFTGSELYMTKELAIADKYEKLSLAAKWDGKGDFDIRFTGEILIYGVSLFNDTLADVKVYLATRIEQTEEKISLTATKSYVDSATNKIYADYRSELSVTATQIKVQVSSEIGELKRSSGWITTEEGNSLWAKQNEIVSLINQTPKEVRIEAEKINLVGKVNITMLDTSIIEAGCIKASLIAADKIEVTNIKAVKGSIANFTIGEDHLYSNFMDISSGGIAFYKDNIYAGFGISSGPATLGIDVPIWVRNTKSDILSKYGMFIEVAGSSTYNGNYALHINKGFISGFSIKPLRIASGTTLSHEDGYVTCSNTSAITVYLPPSPEPGKLVFIRRMTTSAVTVHGNNKTIHNHMTNYVNSITIGSSDGDTGMFFYDGQYWCYSKLVRNS